VEFEHVLVVLVVDDFVFADKVVDLVKMEAVAAVLLQVLALGYLQEALPH
jgi:hypothetical protein